MRNRLGMSLVTGLAVTAGLGNVSCTKIDCGEGTIERDGTCVPADDSPDVANCTPGTVLGPLGCEVETPTQCDPATTQEVFDDQTGLTTCVGIAGGCTSEISCAPPATGKASLCGRLWDVETDTQIAADTTGTQGTRCDPANPATSGPCSFDLKFYDALDFASDPVGAQPLMPPDGPFLDNCGRFKGIDMPRATFGFIGIGVDDAPTAPDMHRLTGVATSNAFASPGTNFRAYTTLNTTDTLWTTGAGLSGMTFSQRGVLAITFRHAGTPVAGVQVRRNGATIAADDYYFTDTDRQRKMVSATPTTTGANGSVLVVNSPTPIAHDGIGAEVGGCIWPSSLAASIPTVVFVQIKDSTTPGGVLCQ